MTGRIALPRERAQIKEKTAALMAETEKRLLAEKKAEVDYLLKMVNENHKRVVEQEALERRKNWELAQEALRQQKELELAQEREKMKSARKAAKEQAAARLKKRLWHRFLEGVTAGAIAAAVLCWAMIRAGVIG